MFYKTECDFSTGTDGLYDANPEGPVTLKNTKIVDFSSHLENSHLKGRTHSEIHNDLCSGIQQGGFHVAFIYVCA